MTSDDPQLITFMKGHNFYNLIKEPTCFKSANGTCIDLILTNQKHSHMFSQTFEVGFSDFHVMVYTMLKTTYVKLPPKVIKYRCRRNYNERTFYNDLMFNLADSAPGDYNEFQYAFQMALDNNMPLKKKLSEEIINLISLRS